MVKEIYTPKPQNYLNKDIKPIISCLFGLDTNFEDDKKNKQWQKLLEKTKKYLKREEEDGYNVDITKSLKGYAFSDIDEKNKFSEGLCDCVGLIVVGKEKNTGKDISFSTHQNPKRFLHKGTKYFIEELQQKLNEIKNRCIPGTIDSVIVGGQFIDSGKEECKKNYENSVELVSSLVLNVFDFKPTITNGPKTSTEHYDDYFFETKERRLYFIRPKINSEIMDYTLDDIEIIKNKCK